MDKLLKILGTIYDTKKRMKAVLGTQSDDICEYPTLIHNYFVDAYNEYYPEGYVDGYNDAWTQILGTQPLVPPTTPEQRQKQEYTPNIPTVTEYRDQRLADNLSTIMEEVYQARLGMKEELGTNSDLFVTYPDLLENMIEEQGGEWWYNKGYEDGYNDAQIIINGPDITFDNNTIYMSTDTTGGTIYYSFDNENFSEYTTPIEVFSSGTVYGYTIYEEYDNYTSDTNSLEYEYGGVMVPINDNWLTFELYDNGEVIQNIDLNFGVGYDNTGDPPETWEFEYRINNGEWINSGFTTTGTNITLRYGEKIQIRSKLSYYDDKFDDYIVSGYPLWQYVIRNTTDDTKKVKVSGNIMSLLYNDYYCTKLNRWDKFEYLFSKFKSLFDCSELILPGLVLSGSCYYAMFNECNKLVAPPQLPAITLASSCYHSMFERCYSITTVPLLQATNLATYCYDWMFAYCTGLTSVPINLLQSTILTEGCYEYMFYSCTNLTNVPNLPATTLAVSCYDSMFRECSSLTTVPENLLPAYTLRTGCYRAMFWGCTSLTSSPILPAAFLVTQCYQQMFYGCSSLIGIKCLATTFWSGTNKTLEWVKNVSQRGTFVKAAGAEWSRGEDGIPSGWNVIEE